jgi:glucosamine--fructose-6-phosphate aminotransferase (isomerizing)
MLGTQFAAEIAEQPAVWRRIADSDAAARLAHEIAGRAVVFLGSGSSLFVAMLGALALRRRGVRAVALAASEARFDAVAYQHALVVALSQSGSSADVLDALDRLRPARMIALTNTTESPLGERADLAIDVLAGAERAVPASKSVTSTCAILLWAAALAGGSERRNPESLRAMADAAEAWLAGPERAAVTAAAATLAIARPLIIAGAGYGVPVALEAALKIKEASYVPAEGFAAGEFRHGSSAVLDGAAALIGIVDAASRAVVERPLAEAAGVGAARFTIGLPAGGADGLGPANDDAFNPLAWLITAQSLALDLGRARGVDSDTPRGLQKALTT